MIVVDSETRLRAALQAIVDQADAVYQNSRGIEVLVGIARSALEEDG